MQFLSNILYHDSMGKSDPIQALENRPVSIQKFQNRKPTATSCERFSYYSDPFSWIQNAFNCIVTHNELFRLLSKSVAADSLRFVYIRLVHTKIIHNTTAPDDSRVVNFQRGEKSRRYFKCPVPDVNIRNPNVLTQRRTETLSSHNNVDGYKVNILKHNIDIFI